MEFNTEQLNIIFPFHLLVNESLNIINFGSGLKKICPGMEKEKELSDFLELKAPFIPLAYGDIVQKVNKEIAEINESLEQKVIERTKEIQKTLTDLKSAQAQLIQSEKMASLGELTAGIAHEIQNPLNFVNNFSEVNKELIEELLGERKKGHRDFENENHMLDSIKENEEKIVLHGKRAEAIVKAMLQHSRTSSGQKEPTDINALADEYLRLAYHGLRAKDKR